MSEKRGFPLTACGNDRKKWNSGYTGFAGQAGRIEKSMSPEFCRMTKRAHRPPIGVEGRLLAPLQRSEPASRRIHSADKSAHTIGRSMLTPLQKNRTTNEIATPDQVEGRLYSHGAETLRNDRRKSCNHELHEEANPPLSPFSKGGGLDQEPGKN